LKHHDDCYKNNVLLVDDEEHFLNISKLLLRSSGIKDVLTTSRSLDVMPLLASEPVSVIVLDLHMPEMSGVDLLPKIVGDYPHIPVILVTANDEIETVVTCMKSGAFDYIVKPINANSLVTSIRKALDRCVMSNELSSLKQRLLSDYLENPAVFNQIVTGNKKMRAIFQYTEVVAATHQPILISGETGVGKELFARAIHELSGCKGEFVAFNVAGLDDNMFSDTLFGHKKGAFTGAEQAREGMVCDAVIRHTAGILSMDSFKTVVGDVRPAASVELEQQTSQGNPLNGMFGHFPTIGEVENYMIDEAMKMAKGNQGMAANLLGIGRQTLNKRLKNK